MMARDKQVQIEGLLDRLYRQAGTPAPIVNPFGKAKEETVARGAAGTFRPVDIDGMISRVFKGAEREMMQEQIARGRETARETRRLIRDSRAAAAGVDRPPPSDLPPAPEAPADTPTPPPGEAKKPTTEASGGPRILLDYIIPPPHTLQSASGRYRETFRWFDRAFLVYDPSIPEGQKGSESDPWFGLAGPKFRCYYPHSGDADFESIMVSGSAGRWLHNWPQRSNYVYF